MSILQFLKQAPTKWLSKHQSTIQTATYKSEYVNARIAAKQINNICYTLSVMSVPLGHIESVKSLMIPQLVVSMSGMTITCQTQIPNLP
jgi:hypothetical protein